jgi:translation initiation factor 4E
MQLSSKDIMILLLSSVLVSTEAPAQRKTRGANRNKKDEASIVIEGMEIEGEKAESLNQLNNHLNYKWDLSYKSHKDTKATMNKQDYLREVKKEGTFDTISGFWSHWNDVQRHHEIGDSNYNLFKQGIKPVWEDPKNINGGKYFVMTKGDQDETIKQWIHVMLALILGEFRTDVNGAVLSVRSWGNTFAIWVRDAKDKRAAELIGRKLKDIFGPSAEVRYQRHQTVLRKMKTKRSPHVSDNESGGEASSEGEQQEKSTRRRFSASDATRGKFASTPEPTPFGVDFKSKPPVVSVLPTETKASGVPQETAAEQSNAQSDRRASTDAALNTLFEEKEEAKPLHIVKQEPLSKLGKIGLAVMIFSSLTTGAILYALF